MLGTDSGPPGIGPNFAIARSPTTGSFWYSSTASAGEVLVFDADGSFLRSIGGRGEGPGEFQWVNKILPTRDAVHLIDVVNQRWTVVSDDFVTRATQPLTRPPFQSTLVADSLLVVSMQIPTRSLAGHPLHVFELGEGLVRSFGSDPAGYRADVAVDGLRQVSSSGDSAFWAAHINRYQLDQWDVSGRPRLTLHRRVDWFPSHFEGMKADPDVPPAPWLVAVNEDSVGRLWTATLVADEEWHRGLEQRPDGSYRWTADRTRFLDTMIEVLDPTTASVLATFRWDMVVAGFVDATHVAVYRESASGVPRVEIWHVALRNAPRR